jgi:flagella basal body P-ring formation protein FlgA
MIIALIFLISTLTAAQKPDPEEHTARALVQLAETRLAETWPEARFQVNLRWTPKMLADKSKESLREIQFSSNELPRGLTTAEVHTADGARFPVQLEVTVMLRAATLKSTVSRGDVISREDLTYNWMEFTNYRRLPADVESSDEWLASRPLRQGNPLLEGDLKQPPSIRRGEQAVMIYRQDMMTIELFCRARQDGATGDVITFTCDETGKRYRAEILDTNYVKWRQTL